MSIVANILRKIYAPATPIGLFSWWPTLNIFKSEAIRQIDMQIGYNTVHGVCNEVADYKVYQSTSVNARNFQSLSSARRSPKFDRL